MDLAEVKPQMPNVENLSVSNPQPTAPPDAQALSRLAEIAAELGDSSAAGDIAQLVSRINEGRFFVACVGQFKRGKSTLLDALVGEELLPTGVVPVTTVPTVLRYGRQRNARVLIDGKWKAIRPEDLGQYVSEELNPENEKGVEGVEAFLASPLLASGMCLVDTPGIGSVFSGNTEATNDFIPQIDAAILVVGADPPISGDELALMEAVGADVDHIFVVLNKMDRVSLHECRQAGAFATKVLATRLKKPVQRIYEVSALNRLNGSGNNDDWEALTQDLKRLASQSGQDMTRAAAERGVRRFSASLRRSVEQRLRALTEPIANSEQRIANLRQTVSQAEQSLRDLGTLFSAEQTAAFQHLAGPAQEIFQRGFPRGLRGIQAGSKRRNRQLWSAPAARADGPGPGHRPALCHALAGCGRGAGRGTVPGGHAALREPGERAAAADFAGTSGRLFPSSKIAGQRTGFPHQLTLFLLRHDHHGAAAFAFVVLV